MPKILVNFLIVSLFVFANTSFALAQTTKNRWQKVNANVVGIVSGSDTDSSMTRFAQDLTEAFNEEGRLRILPTFGRGSVGNIEDLLYLRGVDLALVQGDVLDFFLRFEAEPNILERVRYIAELGREEIHLLARDDIKTIDDLQGRRVNFGKALSGSFMAGNVLLDDLGVRMTPSTLRHEDAIAALKSGDMDAMFVASSAPISLFDGLSAQDGVHFVAIPFDRLKAASSYTPGVITSQQYPQLIPAGRSIDIVTSGTILAAFNWPPGHPRRVNVERFVKRFHERFAELQRDSYHPAWKGIDPNAEVPGWRRFE